MITYDRRTRVGPQQWRVLSELESRFPFGARVSDIYNALHVTHHGNDMHHVLNGLYNRRMILHLCIGHVGPPGRDCMIGITEAGRDAQVNGGHSRYRRAVAIAAQTREVPVAS